MHYRKPAFAPAADALNTTVRPTTAAPTTRGCTEPIWSEWGELLACSQDCGACGTKILRRNCTTSSQGCYCPGESQRTVACNIQACDYPKPAFPLNVSTSSRRSKIRQQNDSDSPDSCTELPGLESGHDAIAERACIESSDDTTSLELVDYQNHQSTTNRLIAKSSFIFAWVYSVPQNYHGYRKYQLVGFLYPGNRTGHYCAHAILAEKQPHAPERFEMRTCDGDELAEQDFWMDPAVVDSLQWYEGGNETISISMWSALAACVLALSITLICYLLCYLNVCNHDWPVTHGSYIVCATTAVTTGLSVVIACYCFVTGVYVFGATRLVQRLSSAEHVATELNEMGLLGSGRRAICGAGLLAVFAMALGIVNIVLILAKSESNLTTKGDHMCRTPCYKKLPTDAQKHCLQPEHCSD
ncbi:unnamed protein product, partial [Mesorhabditis spiculigera]